MTRDAATEARRRGALIGGLAASLVLAGAWLVPAEEAVAAGSWQATAPGLRLAVPGRLAWSRPLTPGGGPSLVGREIDGLSWRFRLPPGRGVRAWLCQDARCLALAAPRGQATGLAGWSAARPLRFRFALAAGDTEALRVQGMAVIVDYR